VAVTGRTRARATLTLTNYPRQQGSKSGGAEPPPSVRRILWPPQGRSLWRPRYIDRSDFRAHVANGKKYYGLVLVHAYQSKCQSFKTDAAGNDTEIRGYQQRDQVP